LIIVELELILFKGFQESKEELLFKDKVVFFSFLKRKEEVEVGKNLFFCKKFAYVKYFTGEFFLNFYF
jgi:hypothetical protein